MAQQPVPLMDIIVDPPRDNQTTQSNTSSAAQNQASLLGQPWCHWPRTRVLSIPLGWTTVTFLANPLQYWLMGSHQTWGSSHQPTS